MTAEWKRPDYGTAGEAEGGFDAWSLESRTALTDTGSTSVAKLEAGVATIEARVSDNSTWVVLRWPEDAAIAIRCGYWPQGNLEQQGKIRAKDDEVVLRLKAPSAKFETTVRVLAEDTPLVRLTVKVTPSVPLLPAFWPRDIYPLDKKNSPEQTTGNVYAAQRESAAGFLYALLEEPGEGTFLYMQNLTALNEYCHLTKTNLQEAVGGVWPTIGLSLPAAAPGSPLPAGREVVISDAFVGLTPGICDNEARLAECFLEHVAAIYPHLEQPQVERHDWPWRSEQALNELIEVKNLTVKKSSGIYVRPYLDAEVPDSTVQLAVLLPALDYSEWRGDTDPPGLLDELRDAMGAFFDRNIGSILRYLPDVAEEGPAVDGDRDRWSIDAWYLYHPLMQLANLAVRGNEEERKLFLESLDFGIDVAHKFKYEWPINFNLLKLEPMVEDRDTEVPAKLGETDVPGLYAYTMLDAYDLTGEERYLQEAEEALKHLDGLGFEIGYQFNNVAWGMAATTRLWQERNEDAHFDRMLVLMASIIHHCQIWESECGYAQHYPNFMAVNCLHDAAYSAAFEEFEILLAFHEVLRSGGDSLPDSVRMLIGEYCRHLLNRAWYYYPDQLPEEAIATEQRQGRIDRALSMPLEDLYPDGQPNGQVGQEVYGCGLAFILTTRAFVHVREVDASIYCDYPILDAHVDTGRATVQVGGHPSRECRLEFVAAEDADLKAQVAIALAGGKQPERVKSINDDGRRFNIPGGSHVIISW
ncbi:MAG: hypothetical protein GX131_15475 [candidate division WS1 bacterium]|nr:hypothetical protein [candidate division WS1 bacterium]